MTQDTRVATPNIGGSSNDKLSLKVHPRVLQALGWNLVTSDVIAILELVKNSYDAFATSVDVKFSIDPRSGRPILEIIDNGIGMTLDVIRDVWCVIGTPFRLDNPFVYKGGKKRRVSGEKGLGRFAAMRLGKQLEIITKPVDEGYCHILVKWDELLSSKNWESVGIEVIDSPHDFIRTSSGTTLRIHDLRENWDPYADKSKIDELEAQLSRLVLPYNKSNDFTLIFTPPGTNSGSKEVLPPDIFNYPPYLIEGDFDESGKIKFRYCYNNGINSTEQSGEIDTKDEYNKCDFDCTMFGSYKFEFRAWDTNPDDLIELNRRFNINRNATELQKDILSFSGVYLYRDNILVLPKSSRKKDWLELSPRRVSRIGNRLDDKNLVGYVEISADHNQKLVDTSDRERLVENPAYDHFRKSLIYIIKKLEGFREKVREEPGHSEPPMKNLFADMLSSELVEKYEKLPEGTPKGDYLRLAREDQNKRVKAVGEIEKRFYYYSRLASIGIIAVFLQHEVGNHTVSIESFINHLKELFSKDKKVPDITLKRLDLVEKSVRTLKRLANKFAPLANRAFKSGKRSSGLVEIVRDCVQINEKTVNKFGINIILPKGEYIVAVDPGELTTIFLNLIDNAVYWLIDNKTNSPKIVIEVKTHSPTNYSLTVLVHDNGPGIEEGQQERIFWPGVTSKPEGIGMGLTVTSELVSQYGGKMYLIQPGDLGGASFGFDLPIRRDNGN